LKSFELAKNVCNAPVTALVWSQTHPGTALLFVKERNRAFHDAKGQSQVFSHGLTKL